VEAEPQDVAERGAGGGLEELAVAVEHSQHMVQHKEGREREEGASNGHEVARRGVAGLGLASKKTNAQSGARGCGGGGAEVVPTLWRAKSRLQCSIRVAPSAVVSGDGGGGGVGRWPRVNAKHFRKPLQIRAQLQNLRGPSNRASFPGPNS
jgi:hypothetical protein